jgi:aerobic carbon-monoxide dehydrogenase large subunit
MSYEVIGARVRRIEDPRLLRGAGRFLADVPVADALQVAFVRSPLAHARIGAIDCTAARTLPGVHAVWTAAELAKHLPSLRLPVAFPAGQLPETAMPFALAPEEVNFVGEAVALVVAETAAAAEDAAAQVEVDWQPLPVAADYLDALRGQARLHKRFRIGYGDIAAAFAGASHVFRETYQQHRGAGHPMETRGVLARPDPLLGTLTLWSSTQKSHDLARSLAEALAIDVDRIRVIAPDVGGGFGTKNLVYPEEVAVAAAAMALGRSLRWVEDRREHFVSAIQERDQYWDLEVAVDDRGVLLGIRGTLLQDQGAYAPHSVNVPHNSATTLPGPYMLAAYDMDVQVVFTNKPAVIPVRGAGYPQSCFAMERLIDRIAQGLALDRAEVRSRNLIPAERFPYEMGMRNRAGGPVIYDSGDYHTCQRIALEHAGYSGFAARQRDARAAGRYLGIGIAHGVKGTGRGPFESGSVRITPAGKVCVSTGALAMGQGICTGLAQICAEALGLRPDQVEVIAGDTAAVPLGLGGYASRQLITAGSSVHLAAQAVRDKALKVAAHAMEAAEGDLELKEGRVQLAGVPDHSIGLGQIAGMLRGLPGYAFPEGVEPGLEATFNFRIDALAYANAVHVCEVEVDIGTGRVQILRYVALQDAGRLVNPLIVEGQIQGGIVHGIGNALFEHMAYDQAAQPLSTTFADYLLPGAVEMPNIEILFHETLSPINPLGVKGVGEGGTIPAAAAVASAVENALEPFGIRITEVPIQPAALARRIAAARP